MSSIRLSPKYGLNPSLMLCFFCQEAKGVAVPGLMRGDVEAPHKAAWDMEPCDKCKGWMADGVIFISVRDGESGDNPYRTGGWCVVTEDFIKRAVQPQAMHDHVLKARVAFVPDAAWDALKLPRGNSEAGDAAASTKS